MVIYIYIIYIVILKTSNWSNFDLQSQFSRNL